MVSKDVEYACCFEAETICRIILILEENLKKTEKEMNSITDSHHIGNFFKSLPGAGKILSCKLLALFGDNKEKFTNYNGA